MMDKDKNELAKFLRVELTGVSSFSLVLSHNVTNVLACMPAHVQNA